MSRISPSCSDSDPFENDLFLQSKISHGQYAVNIEYFRCCKDTKLALLSVQCLSGETSFEIQNAPVKNSIDGPWLYLVTPYIKRDVSFDLMSLFFLLYIIGLVMNRTMLNICLKEQKTHCSTGTKFPCGFISE